MKKSLLRIVLASAISGPWLSLAAQASRSVWSGVYAEEQAERGRSTYLAQSCVQCHDDTLGGNEFGPALVGDEFVSRWSGNPVANLFALIHETMPANNPGRLSTRQAADLLAYLLKTNGFPAGGRDLEADAAALKIIIIEKKPSDRP
jgi:quinoprotein glucose dehydrogenase